MAEQKAIMDEAKAEMQAAADAAAQAAAAIAADQAATVKGLGDLSAILPPPVVEEPVEEAAPAEPAEEVPAGEAVDPDATVEEVVEPPWPPINSDVYAPAIEAVLANTCFTAAYVASVAYEVSEPGEPGEDGEPTPAVETAILTYIAANEADAFLVGTTRKGGVSGAACSPPNVVEVPNVLNSEIKYFKTPKFGAYVCAPIVDFSGKARLVLCCDSLSSGASMSAADSAFVGSVATALSCTSHPMPMKLLPAEPAGKMCIVECAGGDDKGSDGHRADTMHLANAVIDKGWAVDVVVYSDADHDAVKAAIEAAQSVIVRAIEVPEKLAELLGEVAASKTVSPAPAMSGALGDVAALKGSALVTAPVEWVAPEPAEPAEGEEAPPAPEPPAPVVASLRVSMIFDTPVLVTQSSGTRRTDHTTAASVDAEEYAVLMEGWKADIPGLMATVGLETTPLPLIWSADFGVVAAPEPAEGEEPAPVKYEVCAFDVGCVGVSKMLHVVPAVADAAIAITGPAPEAAAEGGEE